MTYSDVKSTYCDNCAIWSKNSFYKGEEKSKAIYFRPRDFEILMSSLDFCACLIRPDTLDRICVVQTKFRV